MYFFVLFYGAAKVQNLKGKKIQPISPPASKPIFWLCLEQPDTGVASPKVWPWLYLLSHPGRELTPCQFWAETWAIHQVFKQHPGNEGCLARACLTTGRCCPDSHERIPNMTFQNSVLIFLGFVLMCRITHYQRIGFCLETMCKTLKFAACALFVRPWSRQISISFLCF